MAADSALSFCLHLGSEKVLARYFTPNFANGALRRWAPMPALGRIAPVIGRIMAYLSYTVTLKIGLRENIQIPDQPGLSEPRSRQLLLLPTPLSKAYGEVGQKQYAADKTNWRKMYQFGRKLDLQQGKTQFHT